MMGSDRKRRVDRLVEHFESKLNSKRRRFESLQVELRWLEFDPTAPVLPEASFQANPDNCSTPLAKKSTAGLAKANLTPLTSLNDSTLSGEPLYKIKKLLVQV